MDRIVDIEIRGNDILKGTLITEGRASVNLKELFVPGAVEWPATGILVRAAHLQEAGSIRAHPARIGHEIQVECKASPEIVEAVNNGRNRMSVEFRSLDESTTPGSGIREISRALLVGGACTDRPCYSQTKAELRGQDRLLNDYLYWGL